MRYRDPFHLQLRELLREKVECGEWKPGERIPSEREMAEMYQLSRMTVRTAITALVNEGLLKRVQGKGTFITKPKMARDVFTLKGFSETMLDQGAIPTSALILQERIVAGQKYGEVFQLGADEDLYRICRLRFADQEPYAIEDTYIPFSLIPEMEAYDFEVFSLYELFQLHAVTLDHSKQTLTLVKASEAEARLLNISAGTALFMLEYITYDQSQRVIEYTRSYTRSDKCKFYTELR